MLRDTLALGRELVRNLNLDPQGTMLERWLAHHLAALMTEAEEKSGPAKAKAEGRAVDLILRLWAKRQILPAVADPLGEYRDVIAVLSRLVPDRNMRKAFARHGDQEDVFHELFECIARVFMGSLVLTLTSQSREIATAEKAAMEQEELVLWEHFDWWRRALQPALPSIVRQPISHNATKNHETNPDKAMQGPILGEPGKEWHDWSNENRAEGGDEISDGTSDEADKTSEDSAELRQRAHESVTAELERLQQQLASLVKLWSAKTAKPT